MTLRGPMSPALGSGVGRAVAQPPQGEEPAVTELSTGHVDTSSPAPETASGTVHDGYEAPDSSSTATDDEPRHPSGLPMTLMHSAHATVRHGADPGDYGALFIRFNTQGDPKNASAYFKDVTGRILDEFTITLK